MRVTGKEYIVIRISNSSSFRSRILSLNLGLIFTGIALGPTIGGLLIRFTGQVLSIFYVAGCLHVMYSFLVWFIIPESLTKGHMELAKARYYADSLRADPDSGLVAGFTRIAQRLFSFLKPLAIFGPTEKVPGNTTSKGRRKDWNLTLLAVAYGFTIALLVSVLKCIFNNI
jgi:MFS family permease